MSRNIPSGIECSSVNPVFVVPDIQQAIEYYTQQLGFTFQFDWGKPPHFAGVNFGKVSLHLMKGTENAGKGFAYFVVENVDELYQYHRQNGVEIVETIANRDYDMRDYHLRDFCGNGLGFGQYTMSKSPALTIERVDMPLRLEKRLAAVLRDLAEHKQMSIDSTIEETLLHTFEPLGDGVASPHTRTTLRYIEQLKQKHGIDYDVHASYRFVE